MGFGYLSITDAFGLPVPANLSSVTRSLATLPTFKRRTDMDPLTEISTRQTSQSVPATPAQVKNSAGGYTFATTDLQRALRFLILGSDGGSYYASQKDLTVENAKVILDLAADKTRGIDLVNMIHAVSVEGRAARQNPTIFALAVCAGSPVPEVRKYALSKLNAVCRTATMLFLFIKYVRQFRGRGRGLQTAVNRWYLDRDVDKLTYQMVKYRNREGFTHGDVLRLFKPKTADPARNGLFGWATGKPVIPSALVAGYELAKATDQPKVWVDLITGLNLPWEALPDAALNEPAVWEALLPGMGITALQRNLARLTKLGVIAPMSETTNAVALRLTDADALRQGRVHPLNLLIAMETYRQGHGLRGNMEWTPVPKIIDALNDAFYLAFGTIDPANKRTMVALDVSGSMGMHTVANTPLSARVASAAMAMTVVRTEPEHMTIAFSDGRDGNGVGYGYNRSMDKVTPIDISPSQRLDAVLRTVSTLNFGGTDCAMPMLYATKNRLDIDTFLIYTDNETWAGRIHPHQALEQYRQMIGHDARLVTVGMCSNGFSIADPSDPGEMDVVGFDTATPEVIRGFSAGDF